MTLVADFNPNVSVPFSRLRQLFEDSALQAGVVGANDFKVAQRGAGANMSVDVPAGQAWVEVTTGTRNGLAHIVNDATANLAVTASHATLPRIDQVVLQYNDSQIPTGSGDVPTLTVLAGTATSGATLDNRTGAAALGNDRLRLADILVPAASTSVTTANIRDRRPWARGAYAQRIRTLSLTTIATSNAPIDSATFQTRIECTGNPFRFLFIGDATHNTTDTAIQFDIIQDGTVIIGSPHRYRANVAGDSVGPAILIATEVQPTAGSHLYDPRWATAAGTASLNINSIFVIEEIVRPNASNT